MAAKTAAAKGRAAGRQVQRGRPQADSDEYEEESEASEEDAKGGDKDSMMTWVACDKCDKWRRIKSSQNLGKGKWFCKMNPDVRFNDCSIEAEEEEDPDQRLRAHLHLWVHRLQGADDAEARILPLAHGTRAARRVRTGGDHEWVQCCDPGCGKWRALHRAMDAAGVQAAAENKEWFCVMNSWDEALASCRAPQEMPADGARDRALHAAAIAEDVSNEDPRARKTARTR